jgi:4-diphosphocytidyl-2-C-methyl-D-erythritol kinase
MLFKAPAKINLFLMVLRKRADNYHDIASLMQKITLYDELSFSLRPQGIILNCPDSDLPNTADNLVFRAAQAIFNYVNYPSGIEITLNKNIPQAAGLGGGSSDAATTLMAINEICELNLNKTRLMELGAKLGADVPFFIFSNAALAYGIGDKLTDMPNLPKLNLVLINPGFPLSTKVVYENLNLRLTSEKINYSIPPILTLKNLISELHNDLESVSIKMHPDLQNLKQLLLDHGAQGALMSGSGPTLFGIFSDENSAKKALNSIKQEVPGKYAVFFAQSL